MYRKTSAALSVVLALTAACTPGRQPVASVPAPAAAPVPGPAAPEPSPVLAVDSAAWEDSGAQPAPAAPSSLWGMDLLGSAQYDLPMQVNDRVRMEMEFLLFQRREVVGRWMREADRYDEFVRDVFASYGIPRDLHHLGMVESGYRPTVRSHAGAVGMWQFMPATGRGMGLRIDTLVDERMDPVRSTHAAARHLRDLHRRFRGDWSLAAAAYNAGEGRINRGLGRFGARDFWELAERGDLARETRQYVPRLYAVTIIAKDPTRFGYPAPDRDLRRFAYDSVRVDLATPLSVLAQVGSLPLGELQELNPHLFRQVAPRNYWVWVPLGQGAPLQQAFLASEFRQRGGYGWYRVRDGESLARLAELSGVPEDRIRAMNLSANLDALRPGDRVRLFADAVRVLDARPVERVARRGPRVLGDPAPGTERAAPERRSESADARGESESSSSRSGASSSGQREREGSSASSTRRSEGSSSSQAARSGERSSSSASERRSEGSSATSGRSASTSGARTEEARGSSSSGSSSSRSGSTSGRSSSPEGSGSSSTRSGSASGRSTSSSEGSSSSSTRNGSASGRSSASSEGSSSSSTRNGNASGRSSSSSEGSSSSSARNGSASGRSASSEGSSSSSTRNGSASGRSASSDRPSSSSSTSSTRRSGTASGSSARTHTVEDGETLWGIARRYEVSVDAVREANELDEDETIRPGQTLRIPRASGSATASASGGTRSESGSRSSVASSDRRGTTESASSSRRPGSASESRPALSTRARMPTASTHREHTVGEGETLWGIARRYDTTVESLRRANDLEEGEQIRPGQKLRIPEN
ncbi:MAG TPA: LysM peptidoglycan-binding domain-containing protein [Longimicrobium sp.]|nr:LysM peptidoglycan-binding domain-containing protein [Longimicrobium sp.]